MGVRTELESLSKPVVLFMGLVLLCLIAWADYATGPEVSFAVFYLVPIYFVTWYAGLRSGIPIAFLSVILISIADFGGEFELLRNPVYQWDRVGKLVFFVITAILLGRLKAAYTSAREMSRLDFLTGVANAREFYAVAEAERLRSQRYKTKDL